MRVEVGKSDNNKCVVRIGALTRSDPDAEVHIVRRDDNDPEKWDKVVRDFVQGKKILKYDLEPGIYHVMVLGDKVAGVINTAGKVLPFPWNVFLEAPAEHVKDYQRLSIATGGQARPTGAPQISTVSQAVKRTLH